MARFTRTVEDLPAAFEPDFYKSLYPDLSHMNTQQLRNHFEYYGRREGRIASPVSRRKEFIDLCVSAPSALEIGPFCNPALFGANVSYFDVLDSDGLRERARILDYPIRTVPQVHYVDPKGDLSIIDRQFSAVFSSHCIEHQPDFVHHLRQIQSILESRGRYFIIIPNKLYCFDHFISETTIANIIDASINNYRVHRLESVIEHRALVTHNDPARHWKGDHIDHDGAGRILERTRSAIKEYRQANGSYIDVHAWQFTPESFKEICEQLFELEYTNMYPVRVYDTPYGSNEFCAILELVN
jgi:SAM-dependent methyltransferase